MRRTDGVISEAIYYDVVHMSSTSTYEADAVISPFENKVWESTKV